MARTTIQAPCVNLVTSTMTSTSPVRHAPNALMARERLHRAARPPGRSRSRSSRVQCRTMPAWLSVKETNTPTM